MDNSIISLLGDEIRFTLAGTIRDLGLKNGDTIHVFPQQGTRFEDDEDQSQPQASTSTSVPAASTISAAPASTQPKVVEDLIDQVINQLLAFSELERLFSNLEGVRPLRYFFTNVSLQY